MKVSFFANLHRVIDRDWCYNFVPLNVLRTNGQNLTKFSIHIYKDNI